MKFLLFLCLFTSNAFAMELFNNGEKISSLKFNRNINEINSLLENKGFSFRLNHIEEGSPVQLSKINNLFQSLNLLMIKKPIKLDPINSSVGSPINASLFNEQFSSMSSLIEDLHCTQNPSNINYSITATASSTNTIVWTYKIDYDLFNNDSFLNISATPSNSLFTSYQLSTEIRNREGIMVFREDKIFNTGENSHYNLEIAQEFLVRDNTITVSLRKVSGFIGPALTAYMTGNLIYGCP